MSWIAAGGDLAVTIPDGRTVHAAGPSDRVIRIGEDAQDLPAPVLPATGRTLPALTQKTPPDIVSGWVRLWIAGHLAAHPGWDGVICALHGDVTHWLHVSADEVVSSQSFLTPRLIAALGGADHAAPGAMSDSLSRPERLAAHLRAAEVTSAAAHVTGHLIGAELAAARPYWLGQQVAVIGARPIRDAYAQAIAAQGAPVVSALAADLLPKGLYALRTALKLAD